MHHLHRIIYFKCSMTDLIIRNELARVSLRKRFWIKYSSRRFKKNAQENRLEQQRYWEKGQYCIRVIKDIENDQGFYIHIAMGQAQQLWWTGNPLRRLNKRYWHSGIFYEHWSFTATKNHSKTICGEEKSRCLTCRPKNPS